MKLGAAGVAVVLTGVFFAGMGLSSARGPQHATAKNGAQVPDRADASPVHREVPNDPWMPRPSQPPPGVFVGRQVVRRGPFESLQVNVDEFGNNMPGYAANGPSIVIDPIDPSRIVIGWRQSDTVEFNVRQAGWAFSHDGGRTWSFPGVLEPHCRAAARPGVDPNTRLSGSTARGWPHKCL